MICVPAPTSRPLCVSDADVVAALHAACFDEDWSAPAIRTVLAGPGAWGLLLLDSHAAPEPLGYCIARGASDEAEILSFGILPGVRRRGFGRRLLAAVARTARGKGAGQLFLEVADDNAAARKLYASSGFTTVGRRPDYYRRAPNSSVTAAVMCLDLTAYTLTEDLL